MLIRTSSGSTSVGHLSHAPTGFPALHRPDVSFECGSLIFPVHSLLLAVSSRFFTDFFTYIKGQAPPQVISLDAVNCSALSAVSLGSYLDWVYAGALPQLDSMANAVELLRLGHFLGNASLTCALCCHLALQLESLDEEALLQVFKAAADLKLRQLTTDCLVLLLPQFGRPTADGTVAAAIDHMDAALSKAVLTQLAVLSPGTRSLAPACSPATPGPCSGTSSPCSMAAAGSHSTPSSSSSGNRDSTTSCDGSLAAGSAPEAAAAASAAAAGQDLLRLERVKRSFVRVLEAKGWGQ